METKFDFDFAVNVPPEYQPRTDTERRLLHEFIRSKEMAATYTYLKRVETSYLIESIHRARDVKNWAQDMYLSLEHRAFPVPPTQLPMIHHFAQTIFAMAYEMESELLKVVNLVGQQSLQPTPDSTAEASADFGGPSASQEQEHPDGEREAVEEERRDRVD